MKPHRMIKRITTSLLALGLTLPLFGAPADDLTALMKSKVATITGILRQEGLSVGDKNTRIEGETDALFDYGLMGRLSLGKQAWTDLDAADQKRYLSLFETRIKNSYLEKLHLYTDEEVEVAPAIQAKKDRIEVPSFIIGKDGKTEMRYKFYAAKGGTWLIYDVEIAGVSIVQTYRSQFAEILKNSSAKELVEQLQTPRQQ